MPHPTFLFFLFYIRSPVKELTFFLYEFRLLLAIIISDNLSCDFEQDESWIVRSICIQSILLFLYVKIIIPMLLNFFILYHILICKA